MSGGFQPALKISIQLEQRQRRARHLHRGRVAPDQWRNNGHPHRIQPCPEAAIQAVSQSFWFFDDL